MLILRRELSIEEFRTELKAQGVERDDMAFICPMCNTVQSAKTLIAAGAGKTFEDVEGSLGFSCIGRFTGAGNERIEGKGCNWTLGGLFQTHTLTVITPDGEKHPHFEIATPEQAKALRDKDEKIIALPVERDKYGYWTHPAYEKFCNGREHIPSDEFNTWMNGKGLEWCTEYRDEDEIEINGDGYDISTWQPSGIKGDGWFVGSIHDTEDGAICIWLRNKND